MMPLNKQQSTWLPIAALLTVFLLPVSFAQQSASEQESPQVEQQLSAEDQEYIEWARTLWESMNPIKGDIDLPGNVATLNVPDNFYFLNASDAQKVLVDVWGNPESSGKGVLGMLFPSQSNPFDEDAWGVTIEYEQEGYVEDDDASDIDYQDLLADMQSDTREASLQRVEMGYDPIELVGWAATPYYDEQAKKLYWAKELRFGDMPQNTLNYNIRVLGRKGVLVLNFIAGMEQLDEINQNLVSVLDIAEFKQGSRYADFDPDVDEVAAYGIGALVAGKVIAKTGFFAIALVFLKKFGVFILIGVGVLLRRVFSRKKNTSTDE